MPNTRYRLRSELPNLVETKALLTKIQQNLAEKADRVVFEIGFERFNSSLCTSVVIDPTLGSANIKFKRPGGSVVENYDIADIENIRRLRTKKHLIVIKSGSNPA